MLPSYIATGFSSDGTNSVALKIESSLKVSSAMRVNVGAGGAVQLTPSYGANALGDLFLAQVYVRNVVSPPTTPDGWEPQAGPNTLGNSSHYFYTRTARSTGNEQGAIAFFVTASCAIASIHTFRNVALESFIESLTNGGSSVNTDTILAPSVTSIGPDRLAVAAGGDGEASAPSDFTGAIGGTWDLKHFATSLVGLNGTTWLQAAELAAAGEISGGSFVIATMENYSQQGFALIGA